MKKIGSLLATVVVNFPLEDVRPEQGISFQSLINVISSRYSFSSRPGLARGLIGPGNAVPSSGGGLVFPLFSGIAAPPATVPTSPLTFRNGVFESIAIPQLDVNIEDPVGLSVQAVSTDFGDRVMDDILLALESELGFKRVSASKRRLYASNVVVEFSKDVAAGIEAIDRMRSLVSAAISPDDSLRYEIERITFSADASLAPAFQAQHLIGFVLERRANHPYSENRYFSSAPLKTEDHFAVLDRIASIFET